LRFGGVAVLAQRPAGNRQCRRRGGVGDDDGAECNCEEVKDRFHLSSSCCTLASSMSAPVSCCL
jgi:hypothetical protein